MRERTSRVRRVYFHASLTARRLYARKGTPRDRCAGKGIARDRARKGVARDSNARKGIARDSARKG